MSQNKKWSSQAKLEIALQALKADTTINELCERYQVAPSQVHAWKKELLERGSELFDKKKRSAQKKAAIDHERVQQTLYEKIGE